MVNPKFLKRAARILPVMMLIWIAGPGMVYAITTQYLLEQKISPLECAARILPLAISGVLACVSLQIQTELHISDNADCF